MKPLVSILIPCYNAAPWLAETLESASAQTWTNTEIIVVDDGSTDESFAIAKTFESRNLKVISQFNQGASAARNTALRLAQGEVIQYLDADDLIAPDKIEQQIYAMQEVGFEFVIAGEWARFYTSQVHAQFISQAIWADMMPVEWLIQAWTNQLMMHPAAWLISRTLADQAGDWNESLSLDDDGEYFCRVVLASQGVKFCQGAKSYYRSGLASSLSGRQFESAWRSQFLSLVLRMRHLLAVEDSSQTRQACSILFQYFNYAIYPDYPDLFAAAEIHIDQLRGTRVKPLGGPLFQLCSSVMGWKRAKQVQKFVNQFGYSKAALGWRVARQIQSFRGVTS